MCSSVQYLCLLPGAVQAWQLRPLGASGTVVVLHWRQDRALRHARLQHATMGRPSAVYGGALTVVVERGLSQLCVLLSSTCAETAQAGLPYRQEDAYLEVVAPAL